MDQHPFNFFFLKKNTFCDTAYKTHLLADQIVFIQKKSGLAKYILPLNLTTSLRWIYQQQKGDNQMQLSGFSFLYQNTLKTFLGSTEDLQKFKKTLKRKIFFSQLQDQYEILNFLCLGSESKNGKRYAAKQMAKLEKVQHEMKINSRLKSETITEFKGLFNDNNIYYLIFTMNEGGTLQQALDNAFDDLGKEKVRQIMKQLLSALQYLSEEDVLHLDLKPSNIMFNKYGNFSTLRLIDFGLSQFKTDFKTKLCGTPGYIAPELFKKNSKISCPDMFSAGCIFYYLLFRRPLFAGYSQQEIMKKNQIFDIFRIEKDLKKIDKKSADLLVKMLCITPENRITPEDALKHPYFLQLQMLSDEDSIDESLQNKSATFQQKNINSDPWSAYQPIQMEATPNQIPCIEVRRRFKTK